ncbi:MAG: hypothetical protein AAFV01_01125 [Bacteroidota bacterium]
MQFIYDHLNATLIGTGVFFILVGVQLTGTNSTVDETFFAAARTQMQSFVDLLDEDLANVGAGVPAAMDPFVDYDAASHLTFRRKLDAADSTFVEVEYRWTVADSVTYVDDGVSSRLPLYRVERLVNGVMSGSSPPSLMTLQMQPQETDGTPPATLADATAIYIRFDLLYAGSDTVTDQTARRARWARTYRPANLN